MKVLNNNQQQSVIRKLRLLRCMLTNQKNRIVNSDDVRGTFNERYMLRSYTDRINEINDLIRSLI